MAIELMETLDGIRAEEARRFGETIRDVDASPAALFGDAGRSLRPGRNTRNYRQRLAEAAKLLGNVLAGRVPSHRLREAMTTSDFPQLFGDILERQILGNYAETAHIWNRIARRSTMRDFRPGKRFYVDGGESVLEEVAQQAPYPAASLADGEYEIQVKKYGRRYPFSWEAMVNDDLEALQDIPQRAGRAARRSESRLVSSLYIQSTGPHSSLYTVGNANIITGNPALSVSGLQTGLNTLVKQTDTEGEPIGIDGAILVVPSTLEITALNIVNALQLELAESGGSANSTLITTNWVKTRLTVVVDPYARIINTTSGDTAWYLFANPNAGRPALELAFLRGHEQPEIFMKAPNAVRVGGGTAGPEDFDTDSLEYKLRHCFGAARMDPKATAASNGTNS